MTQEDEVDISGERQGDRDGESSEGKSPTVAEVCLKEAGCPSRA
jgi:hypothetical protein